MLQIKLFFKLEDLRGLSSPPEKESGKFPKRTKTLQVSIHQKKHGTKK